MSRDSVRCSELSMAVSLPLRIARLLLVLIGVACTPQPAVTSAPTSSMTMPSHSHTATVPSAVPGPLVPAADKRLSVMGRTLIDEDGALRFGFPGVTLRFCFRGTQLGIAASSSGGRSRLRVRVNGETVKDIVLPKAKSELHLWSTPAEHKSSNAVQSNEHCAELVHLTETWLGVVTLVGVRVDGELSAPPALPERRLLFIGDSVTCGEALLRQPGCQKNENWWDPDHSYGVLTARALHAQFQLVCFGGKGVVRDWQGKTDVLNAPQFFPLVIPDDTTPTRWDMARYVPDAVVISLGTNDFNLSLGEFPERELFVATYVQFVNDVLEQFPEAQIFLTEGAIVNDDEPGAPQKTVLRQYLRETATRFKSKQVGFVPASHYPGDTCDPHPTTEQHAAMSTDLTPVIADHLNWKQ